MSEICLVHLVWKPLGLQPLRDFIASYKRNPAGVSHRLVIAFNGFDGEADLYEYRDILAGVVYECFVASPETQDLPIYFRSAEMFQDTYFCFLNSYSVILDKRWLAKMHRNLTISSGIGLVGVTGSYESYYSNFGLESRLGSTQRLLLCRLVQEQPLLDQEFVTYAHFPPFPNYHIRTNGFMLARELMLRLKHGALRTKMDCLKLESGKDGITRQIMRMGLKPLVVGRDGRAYEKEKWFESGTFRSAGQHNLLITDNHTRRYSEADPPVRTMIEQVTWRSWER